MSTIEEDKCVKDSSCASSNHRDSSATSDYSSDEDQTKREAASPDTIASDSVQVNEKHVPLAQLKQEEDFHLPAVEQFDAKIEFTNRQERLKLHTFIRDGDFDIVWPNVLVFIVGHLTYLYSIYVSITDPEDRTRYTWFWSKCHTRLHQTI